MSWAVSSLTLIPNSFSNLSSKEGLFGELFCLKSPASDKPEIGKRLGGGTLISRADKGAPEPDMDPVDPAAPG